jgi:hypothetical protein
MILSIVVCVALAPTATTSFDFGFVEARKYRVVQKQQDSSRIIFESGTK